MSKRNIITYAANGAIWTKITDIIIAYPGSTSREIADRLGVKRITWHLTVLQNDPYNKIQRTGRGGPRDPHRYYWLGAKRSSTRGEKS